MRRSRVWSNRRRRLKASAKPSLSREAIIAFRIRKSKLCAHVLPIAHWTLLIWRLYASAWSQPGSMRVMSMFRSNGVIGLWVSWRWIPQDRHREGARFGAPEWVGIVVTSLVPTLVMAASLRFSAGARSEMSGDDYRSGAVIVDDEQRAAARAAVESACAGRRACKDGDGCRGYKTVAPCRLGARMAAR
jgi:hypothetical protein